MQIHNKNSREIENKENIQSTGIGRGRGAGMVVVSAGNEKSRTVCGD